MGGLGAVALWVRFRVRGCSNDSPLLPVIQNKGNESNCISAKNFIVGRKKSPILVLIPDFQMNMGDFSGSSVPGQEGESTQVSWIEGLSNADRDTLTELLANEEVSTGMKLLVEKLPGFSSFYDALYPEETATEATGTGGMGK